MKIINNNFRTVAFATAFMVFGCTASSLAQVRPQDQGGQVEQSMQERAYEELFTDVDNTNQHDILELLRGDENFSIFIELLEDSGLEQSLKQATPVTIFAPTNEAFKRMEKGEMANLKKEENRAMLTRVINTHVLPRKVYFRDFQADHVIQSAGGELDVETKGDVGVGAKPATVMIGGARIIRPDIDAKNGVIHIMDSVIITDDTRDTFSEVR